VSGKCLAQQMDDMRDECYRSDFNPRRELLHALLLKNLSEEKIVFRVSIIRGKRDLCLNNSIFNHNVTPSIHSLSYQLSIAHVRGNTHIDGFLRSMHANHNLDLSLPFSLLLTMCAVFSQSSSARALAQDTQPA